ncbi:hypothetical protein T484DRAFT_1858873, partial [Baffinella frigidus]
MLVVVGWAGCGEAFVTAPGGLRQAWSARGGSEEVGGAQVANDVGIVDPDNLMQDAVERALKKADLMLDELVQLDAVARALKKADSMLDELSNSEASKARREGRQQKKADSMLDELSNFEASKTRRGGRQQIETLKNKKKKQEEDGQKAEQEVKAAKQAKIQR